MKKFIDEKLLTSWFSVIVIYLFLILISECIVHHYLKPGTLGFSLWLFMAPLIGVTFGAVAFRAVLLGLCWLVDSIVDKLKRK